ncbi:DUF881 domain-containing protein [Timonella sp. A28]|uniref:DUF881 domain-containing protein n=1 Tax=Timonella sp. A28 TaxID=3442640 RepID=UPI003EC108A0
MAEKAQKKRSSVRQVVSIAIVVALSAVMFAASRDINKDKSGRDPEDLADLVRIEVARQDDVLAQNAELQRSIDEQTEKQNIEIPSLPKRVQESSGISSGMTPVHGPGMKVALNDAPPETWNLEKFTPDDLVVHQQDLQSVINALWAGGAEAMTLQGQRVTPLTAFKCVGNVLLLHGQVYSPPYVVEAIGNADSMSAAIEESEPIQLYKQYVIGAGLGWESEILDDITMPAATNLSTLKYAHVPENTAVWE